MNSPVRYEWDPLKRLVNAAKHALDFEDARQVFEHPWRWDVAADVRESEQRRLAIAHVPVAGTVCVLVYVEREGTVRCISFRRASRAEREAYREYLEVCRQLHK